MQSGAERASLHPLVGVLSGPVAAAAREDPRQETPSVRARRAVDSVLLPLRAVNESLPVEQESWTILQPPFAVFTAAVSAGTISNRSPTTPRFATSKIGASGSL